MFNVMDNSKGKNNIEKITEIIIKIYLSPGTIYNACVVSK
jgi:hypothetical protein